MSIIVSALIPLFLSSLDLAPRNVPAAPAKAAPVAMLAVAKPVAPAPAAATNPTRSIIPAIALPAISSPAISDSAVSSRGGAELILAQAPGAASDRASIIDRAGKALGGVKTAQGKFSQVDDFGGNSAGAFYISRPGKVRFEYTKPEPMFIISDGVSVSIEEPKRDAYDAVPLASTPLNLFLRDAVDLKRDGSVVDVRTANGSHFVTMEDSTGEAEGQMILEFRAADFELMGWTSVDGSGAQTRVSLTDTKTNVSLKPSLFIVKDPADSADDRR